MGLKYNEPYNSCSLRSSNPKILSFQSNGKARINGFGKVTLSGKLSVSGKPFKKTINISKGIKKITLKKNSYVLYYGESVSLPGYTITPSGGKGSLKWEIKDSDEFDGLNDAVEISGNKIIAAAPGKAVISLVDKDNGASASVNITVKDKPAAISIQQPDSNNVTLGQTIKLKLSAIGDFNTNITEDLAGFLTVSLSDPSAASAKINGQYLYITFKKYGPVTVKVSINGRTRAAAAASTTFNVSAGIDIDYIAFPTVSLYTGSESDTIYVGNTYEYELTVRDSSYRTVSSGLDKLLTIVMDDPSLASVKFSGSKLIVTPIKTGVLTLKVHAADSESVYDQFILYIN